MSADYVVRDGIAVITLDNPPVNGLGLATRTAAHAGLLRAAADPAVDAIVVTGAGRAFSGGADIREFNSPKALTEPTLHTLIATAEASAKPVVAALHAICMGGGLEFALACHYRVALPGTQIGLPEVKLGLLPGAGGTQRLPRVLGLEAALEMIVSGRPVPAEKLAATPLLDEVFAPGADLVASAAAFAHRIAAVRPLPVVGERTVEHADAAAFLGAARARAASKPFPAPLACVEALEAAVRLPFRDGLRYERERFMALMATPESRALRHAFFAERAAAKVAGLAPDTPVRPLRSVAVAGWGDGAAGIASALRAAGFALTARVGDADLVVDAGAHVATADLRPGAILAVLTAALDAPAARAGDTVGLHVAGPADAAQLVEVLRGPATSADVLATMLALAKALKKTAIVARGASIGARTLAAYLDAVRALLDEGVAAQRIDAAMEAFGFAAGPCRTYGLTGAGAGDLAGGAIASRLVRALADEGARLLAQGVAQQASDIDIVWLTGHGFPLHRGGPMFHVASQGAVQSPA